jgi:hypothetical protein
VVQFIENGIEDFESGDHMDGFEFVASVLRMGEESRQIAWFSGVDKVRARRTFYGTVNELKGAR